MKDLAQRNGSSHAYLWHHWLHSDLRLLGLRQFRARAQLVWTGLVSPSDGEAITEREYHLWFARSFCAHLAKERSRPGTYAAADRTPTATATPG